MTLRKDSQCTRTNLSAADTLLGFRLPFMLISSLAIMELGKRCYLKKKKYKTRHEGGSYVLTEDNFKVNIKGQNRAKYSLTEDWKVLEFHISCFDQR